MLPDSPPRTRGAVRLSGPQGGDLIEAEAPAAMSARPWPGFWTTRPTPTDPSTGSGGCSPTSPRPTWWGCCTAMGSAASTGPPPSSSCTCPRRRRTRGSSCSSGDPSAPEPPRRSADRPSPVHGGPSGGRRPAPSRTRAGRAPAEHAAGAVRAPEGRRRSALGRPEHALRRRARTARSRDGRSGRAGVPGAGAAGGRVARPRRERLRGRKPPACADRGVSVPLTRPGRAAGTSSPLDGAIPLRPPAASAPRRACGRSGIAAGSPVSRPDGHDGRPRRHPAHRAPWWRAR